jgi:hypothetical protein
MDYSYAHLTDIPVVSTGHYCPKKGVCLFSHLKQAGMQHSYSIVTSANLDKVWDLCTDVRNWKRLNPDLRDVELKGGIAENAEGYLVPEKGPRRHFRIMRYSPKFSFTMLTRFPFAKLYQRRMISYHNSKTIITQDLWMEGPLRALWWRMVGRRYQQLMPQMMERFRRLAES